MTSVTKNITGAVIVLFAILGIIIWYANAHPGQPVGSTLDD